MDQEPGARKQSAKLYSAAILGVALILAAAIVALTFYRVKTLDSSLSVTGSAKQQVTSDQVKWVGQFTRTAPELDLRAGYAALKRDEAVVREFLKSKGVADTSVELSTVFVDAPFKYNQGVPRQYELRQNVEVKSDNVAKVTEIAKNLQPLVDKEVYFSTQSLEYYYSKLPELRVSLLSDAVKDARDRAERIASSTSQKIGPISSAAMGVVQVLPLNSVEVADYGAYDTSSIEKEVMVTVKASFRLR